MSDKCKQHPWHYEAGCAQCKAWSETAGNSFAEQTIMTPPGKVLAVQTQNNTKGYHNERTTDD